MRPSEVRNYIDRLWNEDGSIFRIYYSKIYYFKKMIELECDKLDGYIEVASSLPASETEKRDLEEYPLQTIIERYPRYGISLRERIFKTAKNENGKYVCACCGRTFDTRRYLQIDHIVPMAKGGRTVPENLQVLCRTCNMRKSDK